METVLIKVPDHPNKAVLINKADFVEGVHELHTEDEPAEKKSKKVSAAVRVLVPDAERARLTQQT